MKDWKETARGIELWTNARAFDTTQDPWVTVYAIEVVSDPAKRGQGSCTVEPEYPRIGRKTRAQQDLVLDLSHEDTRHNFDRRLALRLGAPPEAVEEGVVMWLEPGEGVAYLHIAAGHGEFSNPFGARWYVLVSFGNTVASASKTVPDDTHEGRLLARALAWRSVP